MAGFQSAMYPPSEWNKKNDEAIALLKKVGAEIPDGFCSTGVPYIFISDDAQDSDENFDFSPFRGKIKFAEGSGLNSADISPFPHGPVRLTVIRWGEKEEQCGHIYVGKNTELNGTSILSYKSVEIGNNVLFGPEVVIMDSDGHPADRSIPDTNEAKKIAAVKIEDHAWIGLGAIIMKGVTIGHDAVVAARSLVTKDVPPHCVAAGNPAKIIKDFRKDPKSPAYGAGK